MSEEGEVKESGSVRVDVDSVTVLYSNYCTGCLPKRVPACYIYRGDSLCTKCMNIIQYEKIWKSEGTQ